MNGSFSISIENAFNKRDIDLFKLTGGRFDYRLLSNNQEPLEIRHWGCHVLMETVDCLVSRAADNASFIIKNAQAYMGANYSKDISLEDVASAVFVSPVYFSRFFKQQTGETFVEYLTNLRLAQAVKLLQERKYKMYEISEKVGYRSSKYFNRQFKETFGYTPKEYCRIVLKVRDAEDE
jgi:two-component system response regulator YesN